MQLNGSSRLMQAGVASMMEVMPHGASKGTALKMLLNEMNLTPDKVMALGDGENDIEMIQLAGIGIAVENAAQKVKDAANHVVATNDEDGVADAIERFVLKTAPEPQKTDEEVKTQ
jgi:hydroxymethylpyrimidine pyrophosphatase-like HAD family hydrolase